MNSNILNYVKNSNSKMMKNPIGDFYIGSLRIYIKEPLPDTVNIAYCFSYILEKMPRIFYSNVNKIVIGQFPFLKKREVDAIYKDNCIYLTNNQQTNEDLMSDIIHEIAHSFEEARNGELYDDKVIEKEFISKRVSLYNALQANGMIGDKIDKKYFYNTSYNREFDQFLYKIVGYDTLHGVTKDIFISPYAATCLREYFANAFEVFFMNDVFLCKKYASTVYEKLINYLEF